MRQQQTGTLHLTLMANPFYLNFLFKILISLLLVLTTIIFYQQIDTNYFCKNADETNLSTCRNFFFLLIGQTMSCISRLSFTWIRHTCAAYDTSAAQMTVALVTVMSWYSRVSRPTRHTISVMIMHNYKGLTSISIMTTYGLDNPGLVQHQQSKLFHTPDFNRRVNSTNAKMCRYLLTLYTPHTQFGLSGGIFPAVTTGQPS